MIEEWAEKHKLPSYRIKQFNLAYYQQLIGSWQELTTWPLELRNQLELEVPFSVLKPVRELKSKDGKTIKVLLERADGTRLESVLMRFKDGRNSVCVSCMVGCPVGCTFCATGKMGFIANLSAREIVEQVMYFARRLKQEQTEPMSLERLRIEKRITTSNVASAENTKSTKKTQKKSQFDNRTIEPLNPSTSSGQANRVTNVVFMGMGEPMLNLEPVMEAVEEMTNPDKLGMGDRHITISTSGYVPQIRELIKRGFKGRLAVSLHAPNQKLRQQLMPIVAKVYPLPQLMAVLDEYVSTTNKRISYEYAMIDGVNDSSEQAKELVKLLKGRLGHVNLIPYNPTDSRVNSKHPSYTTATSRKLLIQPFRESVVSAGRQAPNSKQFLNSKFEYQKEEGSYRRSGRERIREFALVLRSAGIPRTIRLTMGDDIAAACGQLANQ